MKKFIINKISINADIEKVWQALTQGKYTQQYMYGCSPVTTWEVGASLLWNANVENKEMTFVKGIVKEFKPFNKIIYTVFDPNSNMKDSLENHLDVCYELESLDEKTSHLIVTQGDFTKVENGKKRYNDVLGDGTGWQPILEKIKSLIENEHV